MNTLKGVVIFFSESKTFNSLKEEGALKEVVFGSLLGDGSLELRNRSLNARFIFTQGLKNKEYFLYVLELFSF